MNEKELPEETRLREDLERKLNWKRWGPYLSERQWATVREDYSPNGDAWNYFSHEQARSRVYRWGEDGLFGICDRECRLAFSLALWNHQDPILKERLFGVTGPQGNHGEDVKECYYFLDNTPTHSYMRALYKYPQSEYPYQHLVEVSEQRNREEPEYELEDTKIFDQSRYFDVFFEYAKGGPDDLLIRITAVNRGPEAAPLTLLPTVWYRNTWGWGRTGEGFGPEPLIWQEGEAVELDHYDLGRFRFQVEGAEEYLFTNNETNRELLYNVPNLSAHVKDAFHRRVVHGEDGAVNPAHKGTKCAGLITRTVAPGESVELRIRLFAVDQAPKVVFGPTFDRQFAKSLKEADDFFAKAGQQKLKGEAAKVWRQAIAGVLWSKKFYYYAVDQWMEGDPSQPTPPPERLEGRNKGWEGNLYNRDIMLMPDSWEYPWYASWDTAFILIPLARVDPEFAKQQLILILREWFMHPNGQVPAYEYNFSDVNPPVLAWSALRLYRRDHSRDREFLAKVFQKLMLNFTWWVNRTDKDGNHIFSGGFLGMDNIGIFDRSHFPAALGVLEEADATAWMASYSLRLMQIALELAKTDKAYEDVASKFFEHFVQITDAINSMGAIGMWDEEDGFYYDVISAPKGTVALKTRSLVGLLPLTAVEVLEKDQLAELPGFSHRMQWFRNNRPHLAGHIEESEDKILLAMVPAQRLHRVLEKMVDPEEFLSDHGIRSLSKFHEKHPYHFYYEGTELTLDYEPAESVTPMFGGNSNWRGPVWFPINQLIVDGLDRFYHFYGDSFLVQLPSPNPGEPSHPINLQQLGCEIQTRLAKLFLPDATGHRPAHGGDERYASDPNWNYLTLFYEYFDGDTGKGLGASHQTGWTALVARMLEHVVENT
jgi:hypothetical protein